MLEIGEWIRSNIWGILIIAGVIYVLSSLRFIIYWISLFNVKQITDLPTEILVPIDVKLGVGFSILLACGSLEIAMFLADPDLSTLIIGFVLNIFIAGAAIAAFALPLRFAKNYRTWF